MSCVNCRCPAKCLAWPAFCAWASEDPPDEVKLRHILERSGCLPAKAPAAAIAGSTPARPSVVESMRLTRAMKGCPYRSTDAGCGCTGGRCSLRAGRVVNHLDCFDCLRRYP